MARTSWGLSPTSRASRSATPWAASTLSRPPAMSKWGRGGRWPMRMPAVAKSLGGSRPSGNRSSRGLILIAHCQSRAVSLAKSPDHSPVEKSIQASPPARSSGSANSAARKLCSLARRLPSSTAVPGVRTLVTARLTSPLASLGSSIWSHTATLKPLSRSWER